MLGCLDAGCGSNGNGIANLLDMGAMRVEAFDLDDSILRSVPDAMRNRSLEFKKRCNLSVDNVLGMSYQDNYFDFVHCSGVLHHTENIDKGIKELSRVLKPGGVMYLYVNGKGGIIREFTNFLREKYNDDCKFKEIIDGLDSAYIVDMIKWLLKTMVNNGDDYGACLLDDSLIDSDLILTIKDRIQAPTYIESDFYDLKKILESHRCIDIERLVRYPKVKNVRRFLSPLYAEPENHWSELMYGSGNIQIKCIKS